MDVLLVDSLKPFSLLAGFIVVLLIVEVGLMLVGLSSAVETDGGLEGPGGALDVDAAFDAKSAIFEADILTPDELATLEIPPSAPQPLLRAQISPARRLLRLTGFGRGPVLVWLTGMAAGISACGYFLQLALQSLTGAMLSGSVALSVVLLPGLLLGGRLTAFVARLIPAFESHAISGRTYNGRRGEVVVGVARRGEPAQVRWRDLYGTTHSLMAEPLRDTDTLPAGSKVLIVKTRDRQPRLVSLSDR